MKKNTFFTLTLCLFVYTAALAQTVTLTFTAKDAADHYAQLNRVIITNLTKSWQEIIYWPDTILTMQNGTGIADYSENGGFCLLQNNPNPFSGATEVYLTVAEESMVTLDIADVNGKIVGAHRMRLQSGTHLFRITLSTTGTYVMTACQNGQMSSIKMVCNREGDGNRIEYMGNNTPQIVQSQHKNDPKHTTTNPFNFGDQMEYVGYATINGSEVESQRITQSQGASQTFILQFIETQYQVPTVTTSAVSDISSSSATVGGSVISDGGTTVFDRGVCYDTIAMPTISDDCIHMGQGIGLFTDSISNLIPGTTYYIRAYATNSQGTSYGNEISFTTDTIGTDGQPCPGAATVTDIDNNIYNTVKIGDQCWMKENLRTTKYADNSAIPSGSSSTYSTTAPYRYAPDNNIANVPLYGYLYNWPAVMHGTVSSSANPSGVQGICPTGWHVPSSAEWMQLTNYVSSVAEYSCSSNNEDIAKSLASTDGWATDPTMCSVGYMPSENNSTGFSARPAGDVFAGSGTFNHFACFWSTTEVDSYSTRCCLSYQLTYVNYANIPHKSGFSVRCLKD